MSQVFRLPVGHILWQCRFRALCRVTNLVAEHSVGLVSNGRPAAAVSGEHMETNFAAAGRAWLAATSCHAFLSATGLIAPHVGLVVCVQRHPRRHLMGNELPQLLPLPVEQDWQHDRLHSRNTCLVAAQSLLCGQGQTCGGGQQATKSRKRSSCRWRLV